MRFLQASDATAVIEALNKSQAVIEFKLDGTILTANQNFLGAMGYSLDEIRGQHHSLFVDPAYKNSDDYRELWTKLGRGEFHAGQFKRLAKGGREVWIEASYNPVLGKGGKPYKVIKFATDISKKMAEYADLRGKVEAIDRSQAVLCPPSFIRLKSESRAEIGAVAPVEQRTIGGAGRGCGADCPLR